MRKTEKVRKQIVTRAPSADMKSCSCESMSRLNSLLTGKRFRILRSERIGVYYHEWPSGLNILLLISDKILSRIRCRNPTLSSTLALGFVKKESRMLRMKLNILNGSEFLLFVTCLVFAGGFGFFTGTSSLSYLLLGGVEALLKSISICFVLFQSRELPKGRVSDSNLSETNPDPRRSPNDVKSGSRVLRGTLIHSLVITATK